MSIMYFSEKSKLTDYKNDAEKQIAGYQDEYDTLKSDYDSLEIRYNLLDSECDNYKDMYSSLKIDTLKYNRYDMDNLIKKEKFLLNHIGFVVTSDDLYYHTYDCSIFKNSDSYWAYNIESCIVKGYIECPLCH